MPIITETFTEFDKRHRTDGQSVCDPKNGFEIWPDGAVRTEFGMVEPPSGDGALHLQQRYYEICLNIEQEAFHRYRAESITQAHNAGSGSVPAANAELVIQQLEQGRARGQKFAKKIAEIKERLGPALHEVIVQQREAVFREREQSAKEAVAQIQAVTWGGGSDEVDE
jgi:hypothetical protein